MQETVTSSRQAILAGQHIKEEKYWLEKLSGLVDKSKFPYDCNDSRPGNKAREGSVHKTESQTFEFEGELFAQLMKLSSGSDIRMHMILTAILAALLEKYTGRQDIVVGVPTLKQEIDADFVNTVLILRNTVEDCMTFKDLLLQVRQTMVEAAQFQNYPVEVLPYHLGVSFTSDDDFPLFDIALLLENIHDKAYIRHLHLNMIFTFSRTGEKLEGKLEYNALRYDKATVRRILSHFRRISEEVLADVNIDIPSIEVLADHEKHQLLVEFSGAVVDIPGNKTLPGLFRDQVEQTPDHIALVGVGITCHRSGASDISMTYEALAEASGGLAGLLKQKGVGPGAIAAICAERSVEMAIGLLGILMAGGAYLPLEQGSPPQSKIYRLKDSRAQALLFTGEAGSGDIDSSVSNLICLENFSRSPYSGMEPNGALSSFDPAYIIYTSGTTGRPKGVLVEHRAAVNTLLCRKEEYRLTVRHSSLQLFSYAFDGFITSFFTPLFSGARVVLPGENGVKDIQQIKAALVRHHVSHFICVPPLYQAIIENLSPGEASSLQVVTLAGDALSPGLLEIGKQKNPDLEIVNEYGITEVAVMSTIYRHQEKAARIVIGRPIWNTDIYIMDQRSRLQPVGIPGELCIGGAGLARGYLNNPELTAEKYNRSYKSYRTNILFKTGDLARWLPDPAAQGAYAIEFLGRKDHQVKIRGFRIEPGEIEHRLLELPEIKDAVVMAAENERGDKSLYAYLVLRRQPCDGDDAEINIPAIRAALLNHLPDHMVPTHFVKLEQMPLTATGKIDRRALTAMNVSAVSGIHFTEPGTPVEKKLADLWAGLLDKKQVGVEDNFFTIGGDSIKTITLLNLVNNEFKTKLKVIDLYENETIAKLAFKVELAVRETENAEDELLLKETADKIETLKNRIMEEHRLTGTEDIYPISDIQEGLIFYALRNTDEALYHIQFVYQIKQRDFDPVLFKKALSLLAQKHSMLRTTFDLVDYPEPVQLVHKEAVLDVEHYDISHMAPTEQEHFLKEVLRQDRARAFDIGQLPLWRMKSALLGNDNIALVSTLHHVIGDGWGSASLNTELRNTYDALKRDPGFTPGKLKSSYKDFIIRQEAEKERKKAAEFWKKELEDYKRADFLVTPKTGESPLDMSNHSCLLEEALLVNLKETALKINTSVKHLCFAAYNYIIGMLSYEKDFVVGLLTNNRPPIEDGEKIFGCFLNTVPARIHIPTGVRWLDYLEIVDKKLVEIKRYDSVSLFEIARLVGENPRDGNPFFDTLFNFVDFHIYDQLSRSSGVGDGSREMEFPDPGFRVPGRQDTNTYFDFEISTTHGYFRLGCRYNRSAISEVLIGKIGVYFENILKEFISRPNALMSRDSVLPEEERRKIVIEFNDTSADFSREKTMHQLFEEQVSRSPEGVAVIDRDGVMPWTYEELNKRSNRLARVLRKKGLKVGGLAAVIMDRSAHMVTAVMAILKAGGAYVPFEPYLPDERIRKLMESLQIEIVITNEAQLPKVERISQTLPLLTHIICPQRSPGEEEEAENLSPAAAAGDIAYVIFTSGSTGVPKGVVETHRPVINVIEWVNKTFAVGYPDKLLFVASLGFDLSVYDIFGILASGACLRVVDVEDIKNPQALLDIIMNEGITFWDSAPAALQQLATFFPEVGNYPVDSCLRLVFLSGDWIPVPLPDAVREAFPVARVISLGGATEATIWSNYYPIGEVDPSWVSIPYGKPIRNATYYILDPHMELCPIGTPGDLYIGGQCLASEYKNDPDLTAAKFIANPFVSGEKLYKTGDLARWFEDGNMEFLGRKDLQVKIRGYRIELGEIESRLLEHEEIHEAVVLVKGSSRDDKYLAAYFTADREFEPGELKTFLLKELPDYMTPRCFVQLQKMPVSANGKLDRKALPEPEVSSESGTVYTAPENKTQEKLADIWSQVLGVDKELIGINADFFRLGGHSLNATMVISRVHKEFNVKVPLAEIFNSPTIRELSLKIKASESELYAGVEPVEKKEYYRLSSAQKRLYFLQQMEPGNTGYNIQEGVLLEGDVNLPLLEETFRQLIQLHESLRTSFETVNEETVQRVHEHVEFTIELLGRGDPTWSSFIRPFDLSKAPLLRVGLFEPEDKKFVLLVDMHHIISDGVSQAVLKRDFGIIYSGGQLPAIRLQYKDYSEWQYSERQRQLVGTQKAYWLNELSGDIPVLDIPTDYPRPMIQSYEGNTLEFDLDQEETELLNKLGRGEKATLYMVLVAIYNVLLFKLSNQEEIIIGTPTAGRRHSDLERIIGMFVNTLALKNYPQTGKSFTSFLQEVKENTLRAFENQDCQFEELVELLAVKRDASRNPIFDVVFVLQNMSVEAEGTPGAGSGNSRLKLQPYRYSAGISKFDLTLTGTERGDGIHFTFEYCTRLFKEETIRRLIEYFKRIVSEVTGTPGKRLSEIDILSEEEKNLLLYDFNDTGAEYPRDKTIHGLFEEQVDRTPDRVGLVGDVRQVGQVGLTYQKLNEQSGQLARLLIEKGVLSDNIVAIKIDRSVEMIVGIMGILKSGGAYLPIDPEYPRERIEYMLKDSGARIMIGRAAERQSGRAEFVFSCFFPASPLPRFLASDSSNLAYIIYTSGSTGNPKGVMIEHRSVINFIKGITDIIPFTPGDCILSLTTISFDIFGLETILPLTKGAKVVIGSQEEQLETRKIALAIEREHVTIFQVIPTRLKLILTDKESSGALKRLKYLLVGGEEFPPALLEGVGNAMEGKIYNVYGPTETTIWSTIRDLTGEKTVDIGKPLVNTLVYILNKNDRLQPLGVPGELYIGGAGLARGYVNRPEITAEKFIEFNRSYRSDRTYIFYKTGDLARWLPGGNIEFLGRIDQQVKIRGFRIELGEIESRLSNYPSIKEAVVIAREDESGDKYLCAYITADTELAVSGLREYLTKDLPDYMIPSYFVPLEKIPLTPNGKLDRKALPGPKVEASLQYAAPRDKVEEKLVAIWADMLRIDKSAIGIDDNFFVLGGHSLRATLMIGRIHKELNVKFPLLEVFKTPNIRSMAKYIKGAVKEEFISLEPLEQKEYYPVSSQQKRLFILQQRYLNLTAYNRPNLFISPVKLNKEKLELTFRKLIQRHESLRTSFDMINGEPVQRIHSDAPLVIEYYNGDLTGDQTGNFVQPFDLSQAPLFRVRIIKPGDGKNILLVDIHHIISDGVSDTILISDFMALFEGKQLPALKFQYKDFSQWQARLLESGGMTKQEKYWLETFTGEIPQLAIPRDYPDSLERRFEGSGIYVELDDKTTGLLKELAMREGTTLFMILFAVYNVLLAKLGGQEDIVVGTGVAGRRHVDFENVIGMFVNTLALRNYPAAEKTFKDFLFEVNQRTLLAFENQDYVFEDLVEKVVTKSDPGRNPIFDTVFVMQNMASKSETAAAGNAAKPQLLLKRQEFDAKISIFDISVFTEEIGGKLGIKVSYSTGVFKQETIEKYFGYYKDILAYVIENKELIFKLKDIRLASGLKTIESTLIQNETGEFGF